MIGNTRDTPLQPSPHAWRLSRRGAVRLGMAGAGAVLLRPRPDRLAAQSTLATPTPDSPSPTSVVPYLTTQPGTTMLPPDPRLMERSPKLREAVQGVTDRTIPGPGIRLPLRLYTPNGSGPFPVAVHFHGGGWIRGNLRNDDDLCRSLASRSGVLVVSLGYRLAPAHPYPAAVEDGIAVVRWLAEHAAEVGADPTRLAVCGRSAGGTLAAATALAIRDRAEPSLRAQVLLLPATNHNFDTASYHQNAEGYGLTRAEMMRFWDQYLARPEDGEEPYASPLRAPDLSELPPALIITAQWDPLRDDGEAYGARLQRAGVPVQVTRYLDATHRFLGFAATVPSADHALQQAAAFLCEALTRV